MNIENTNLNTIEKIKSFAIAVVGAGIFSMGSTYFSPQSSYRIPRILIPIYEIFGNVGLAICMLILGGLLIFYAYKTFTKNGGKAMVLIAFSVVAIVAFYAIIYQTNKLNTPEQLQEMFRKNEERKQEKIANAERPELDNAPANAYLDKLEALEKKFEKAVNDKNKTQFDACEDEYVAILTELGNSTKDLVKTPEYKDFAMYNAKVLEKIQVYRLHKW